MRYNVLPIAALTAAIGLLIIFRAGGSRGIAERVRAVERGLRDGFKPVTTERGAAQHYKVHGGFAPSRWPDTAPERCGHNAASAYAPGR